MVTWFKFSADISWDAYRNKKLITQLKKHIIEGNLFLSEDEKEVESVKEALKESKGLNIFLVGKENSTLTKDYLTPHLIKGFEKGENCKIKNLRFNELTVSKFNELSKSQS